MDTTTPTPMGLLVILLSELRRVFMFYLITFEGIIWLHTDTGLRNNMVVLCHFVFWLKISDHHNKKGQ